jgi:hypothetical protein
MAGVYVSKGSGASARDTYTAMLKRFQKVGSWTAIVCVGCAAVRASAGPGRVDGEEWTVGVVNLIEDEVGSNGVGKAPNAESDGETGVVVPIDYITGEVQIQCGVPGDGERDGVNRNAGVVCDVTLVWVQLQPRVIGVVTAERRTK